jgi:hypothetical protein
LVDARTPPVHDHIRNSCAARPYAILGYAVVCADSEQEAERLATRIDLNWVRRARLFVGTRRACANSWRRSLPPSRQTS